MKDIGRVAGTYPANGIRLRVVTRHDRFAAIPVGDDDICADSMWLTVDDIQLWHFDPEKLAAHRAKYAQSPPLTTTKPVAKVIGGFKTIILPSGKEMNLVRKLKRRTFWELVYDWSKANPTDLIYAEQLVENHNKAMIQAGKDDRIILTDRILHDLFRTQKNEFLELFEILDISRGHLRLKVQFER